jgi:adenosylmethionine-8-amino-7-oxononanoate aminotransferase
VCNGRLKESNVIVANEGFSQNILTFMPPFCISTNDVDFLVTNLTKILAEIEIENSTIIFEELFTPEPSTYVC